MIPLTPEMEAADLLLEHIVYHSLCDRIGHHEADVFIAELKLISEGRVLHGALVAEGGE